LVPTVKLPVWLLLIARSITGVAFTVVTSEEELLAALLSPAVDTLAVLVTEGTAAAPTLTVRVMLLVPLLFAQFATDSVMYLRGVGLDVNTLPVVAVGLGVGIDYGIYLLSRICEEFQGAADGDVQAAVTRAVFTTGEATFFVAFTMVLGVLPWYFLSELRFLAEMGLMLALVMAFAGVEETRRLYELAIAERYRFYSFGDAMLVR